MNMYRIISVVFSWISVIHTNTVDLEDTCGAVLRPRCDSITRFIVGGIPSCAELAPWNVILETKPVRRKRQTSKIQVLCGGTLVSTKHVVTAAHCVWSNSGGSGRCREPFLSMSAEECRRKRCPKSCWRMGVNDLNVYVGVTERIREAENPPIAVKKISIHPGWDKKTFQNNITEGNDIAVIELAQSISFTASSWPICLPSPSDRILVKENERLEVFGFGIKDLDTKRHPEFLQQARLSVVDRDICKETWKITGDQLCAVGVKNQNDRISDSCRGDSGGGIVSRRLNSQNYVLLGVVSFGESDCGQTEGRPSVNTNVLANVDWIRSVTGALTRCETTDRRRCAFPFEFRGVKYDHCTADHDPDDRLWCSTKTDSDGQHIQNAGEWGYCSSACLELVKPDPGSSSAIWSEWGEWSPCTKSCGVGKQVRNRDCKTGTNCKGDEMETKVCNNPPCPESYAWTTWSAWSRCSGCSGSRSRSRSCEEVSVSSAVSLRFIVSDTGKSQTTCDGVDTEINRCSSNCPVSKPKPTKSPSKISKTPSRNNSVKVSGGSKRKEWTEWTSFSSCSTSCRGGVKRRTRVCVGDRGGCYGSPTDIQICGTAECNTSKRLTSRSEALVLIGGWNGEWLNNVTIIDSNQVCSASPLVIPLADHFSALINNKMLICGGRSADDKTLCWTWNMNINDAMESAPEMLEGRSYADAISSGNKVWVTGGWDGKERHKTTEVLSVPTTRGPIANQWNSGNELTKRRYQHCGLVLNNGKVILTGGQDGVGKTGSPLTLVEEYDVDNGYIRDLPSMNQARWTHGCTRFNYKGSEAIIVAGGRISAGRGDELNSAEILVIGDSSWKYIEPLPQPRLGLSLVVMDNTVVATGGSYETGDRRDETFPSDVLEYDPTNDRWLPVLNMPGRNHHAALTVPKTIISC